MSTRRPQQKKNETNWIHSFQVVQPTRHKKDFTVYKVISKVFPKGHPDGVTTITVWKRYNDFKKLFKELQLIHQQLHLFGTFPTFPKGTVFGRFENDIIEERRQASLALLQFATLHPHLYTSKVFSKFFETGYNEDELVDIPPSNLNAPQLEGYLTKPCLVPQKVWAPIGEDDKEEDDDKTSTSSIESSLLEAACPSPPTTPQSMDPHAEMMSTIEPSEQSTKPDHLELLTPSVPGLSLNGSTEVPTISVSHSWENISDSHNELHIESGISSSASCSSLETQVPAMTCEETEHVEQEQEIGMKLLKKSSSFGLFDFLPIFPKKAKEKHLSEEKLLSDSLTSSYICEAAGHFAVAQQFESCGEFPRAFSSYKAGIKVLLTGVQNDDNPKRKRLVRSKLEKYIARAESLHGKSSNVTRGSANDDSSPDNYSSLPVASPTKVKNLHSSLNTTSSHLEELKEYKVIKILDRRVYIVVNVKGQTGPKCSVIKVLPKSLDPADANNYPLMSKKLPFLISLQKWFETEHSYILLLEYASGGRLRDFVNTYQTKQIIIPKYDPDDDGSTADENSSQENEMEKATSCIVALSELGSRSASPRVVSEHSDKSQAQVTNGEGLGSDVPGKKDQENDEHRSSDTCENLCTAMEHENVETLLRMNSLSLDNLKNIDTQDLIQNSKFLLQTVNQTLARAEADDVIVSEKLKEAESRLSEGHGNRKQPNSLTNQPGITKNKSEEHANNSNKLYQEENNNKFHKPIDRRNSRLTVFIDPQEEATNKCECVQTGSPTKLRESSSAIELTETGTVVSSDSETECHNLKRMVPECCVKVWAAEIIMALENLHEFGLVFGELDMKNILLGENGHILLSFKSNWFRQDHDYIPRKNDYSAPEVYNSFGQPLWKIHPSADYWSLGSILFELFTGQNARALHPEGFHEQTILRIPTTNLLGEPVSPNVKSLLAELLQYNPTVRLGYYGAAELKSHPLFEGFDWDGATEAAILEKSLYT